MRTKAANLLADVVAPSDVIIDPAQIASYTTDWTGRFTGRADVVVRPRSTQQTARALAALSDAGFAIQVQGGNTGLVGGSVPPNDFDAPLCLITTKGLTREEPIDGLTGSVTVGAGVTLGHVQRAVARHGWRFGVDLAARDTATVGGLVATNAGGIRVCAFGMMRENVTGVEVALPDGTVISSLEKPLKDNTGLPTTSLAIGSEGALGVITAARLKLIRPPGPSTLRALPVDSLQWAVDVVRQITESGARLLAAEYVDQRTQELILDYAGLRRLWPATPPVFLLVEVAGQDLTWQPPDDALVTTETDNQRALWVYREQASDSWTTRGDVHKLDVSVPMEEFAAFHTTLVTMLDGLPSVTDHGSFGHLADGNFHIEVLGPDANDFDFDRAVLELVVAHGGSISAEHGIGRAKAGFMDLAHAPESLAIMRSVRRVFDPRGVMNPGVIFPAGT